MTVADPCDKARSPDVAQTEEVYFARQLWLRAIAGDVPVDPSRGRTLSEGDLVLAIHGQEVPHEHPVIA